MGWLNRESEWAKPRGIASGLGQGVRLYLHSLWWLTRLWKLWLLLGVLTVPFAWLPSPAVTHEHRHPGAWERWHDLGRVGTNLTRGTSRPLSGLLERPLRLFDRAVDQRFGQPDDVDPLVTPLAVLLSMLGANLVGALLAALVLGRIAAAVAGGARRSVLSDIRRSLPLLYVWFVFLDIVTLLNLSLRAGVHQEYQAQLVNSAFGLVLFPFVLVPAMAVVRGSSLAAVPAGVREFVSRLATVIGFLLPFRVTYDVLGRAPAFLEGVAHHLHVAGSVRQLGIGTLLLTGQLTTAGLALLVSVACVLLLAAGTHPVAAAPPAAEAVAR